MEIIIKDTWSIAKRESQISNYIQMLGMELFKKCKKSKYIKTETLEKININLCIAYIKELVNQYINDIDYGSFSVELSAISVHEIAKIANELQTEEILSI